MIATPTMSARRTAIAGLSALLALVLALPYGTADAQIPTEPPDPNETPTPDSATSKRLAGKSRFDTAAEIAADAFPNGADNVIVARGDTFPDALAGSYLAGVLAAPILLTSPDTLPEGTQEGLAKINRKAYVLGGATAISDAVVAQLRAEGLEVERIAGSSRFDTARLVATHGETAAGNMRNTSNPPGPGGTGLPAGTAFLVTGDSFADALSAGPLAFWGKHPVILTRSDNLSDEAKSVIQDETLQIDQVVVVGGRKAVSAAVEDQVKALEKVVVRVSGATRDETATKLAEFYVTNQQPAQGQTRIGYTQVNLALSQTFPDALALGPRGGRTNSVILLSQTPEQLGSVTRAFIGAQCDAADTVVVAGGTAAINDETMEAATQAAVCGTASGFSASPATYTRIYEEEHQVTVAVKDAAGEGVEGVFVKLDVYRRAAPEQLSQLQPAQPPDESLEGTTGGDGTFTFEYTLETPAAPPGGEPPLEQAERWVACAHPREGFPSPCLGEHQFDENLLIAEGTVSWYRDGYRTTLSGDEEVPGPGDEEAEGTAAVVFTAVDHDDDSSTDAQPRLCWMIDVQGLEDKATAAHIHQAPEGEAGPVVVTLTPTPDADGFAQACATSQNFASGVPINQRIQQIKATPQNYYVNVHNTEFPDGAVRGQLPTAPAS